MEMVQQNCVSGGAGFKILISRIKLNLILINRYQFLNQSIDLLGYIVKLMNEQNLQVNILQGFIIFFPLLST